MGEFLGTMNNPHSAVKLQYRETTGLEEEGYGEVVGDGLLVLVKLTLNMSKMVYMGWNIIPAILKLQFK